MRRAHLPCRPPSLAAALAIALGAGVSVAALAAEVSAPGSGSMGYAMPAGGLAAGGVGYLATRMLSLADRWTRLTEEVWSDHRAGKLRLPPFRVDHHLHDGALHDGASDE